MTLEPASTRTSNLLGVDSNKPGSLSNLKVPKNVQNVNVDKLATDVKSFATLIPLSLIYLSTHWNNDISKGRCR